MIKDFLIADGVAVSVHEAPGSAKGCILLPGFLDSKDYAHLVSLADDLQKQGFTVARVDAFGTWASKGSIEEYSPTRRVLDVAEVFAFLKERFGVKTVVLGGHSMGGRAAVFYAVAHPEGVTAVVSIMGSLATGTALNWPADGVYRSRRDLPTDSSQSIAFEVPASFRDDALRYDAQQLVQKLKVPILFVAGGDDAIVKRESMQEGFAVAPEPKQFSLIPGIGHDYRKHPQQIPLVNKVVLDFLRQHKL